MRDAPSAARDSPPHTARGAAGGWLALSVLISAPLALLTYSGVTGPVLATTTAIAAVAIPTALALVGKPAWVGARTPAVALFCFLTSVSVVVVIGLVAVSTLDFGP